VKHFDAIAYREGWWWVVWVFDVPGATMGCVCTQGWTRGRVRRMAVDLVAGTLVCALNEVEVDVYFVELFPASRWLSIFIIVLNIGWILALLLFFPLLVRG